MPKKEVTFNTIEQFLKGYAKANGLIWEKSALRAKFKRDFLEGEKE